MMERGNYKKRSSLPSINKLLYLTAIVSTLLTSIFLWYSKTSNSEQKNFLAVAIPSEKSLLLPLAWSSSGSSSQKQSAELEPQITQFTGRTITSEDQEIPVGVQSFEIDFDDSFNDYINGNNNAPSKFNGSEEGSTSKGRGKKILEQDGKTGSLLDFEDAEHESFIGLSSTGKSKMQSLKATTAMTYKGEGLKKHVEFKSRDSVAERLKRIRNYCGSIPSVRRSTLEYVMEHLDQRTNKWIEISQVVKEGNPLAGRFNLQWCPVFKAASTPWMAVLMKLKNYLSPEMEQLIRSGKVTFVKLAKLFHMNMDRSLYPNNGEEEGNNGSVYSMLVVRHPFERLLSAYRDKLERVQGRDYYHAKYGLPIVQRFRYRNNWKSTFSVPLMTLRLNEGYNENAGAEDLLVDPWSNRFPVFGRRLSNQRRQMLQRVTPTFNEFVQYLLTLPPAEMDEHWRPIYIDCNACTNSFNLIFKVETMDQDRNYLLRRLQLNSTSTKVLDQIWKRWTNSVGQSILAHSAWKRREEYFSQISRENLQALYELYEPDFLMFGYSPDKYLHMTQQ